MNMDLSIENLKRAREFYEKSPDGQYDDIAVVAINNLMYIIEKRTSLHC